MVSIQKLSIQRKWIFKRIQISSDDDKFVNKVLDNPDFFLLEDNVKQIFKHDKTTTVALIASANKQYVLKRYNARSVLHRFKRALRRTRAGRCWIMSQVFIDAGLNVAPVVGILEKRWGLFNGDAYFLSEYVEGRMLLDYLPEQSEKQQSIVVEQMATVFAKMRAAKITHGDMKASNLLWFNQQVYFIDLDGATKHKSHLSWLRSYRRDQRRFMKNWQQNKQLSALFQAIFL